MPQQGDGILANFNDDQLLGDGGPRGKGNSIDKEEWELLGWEGPKTMPPSFGAQTKQQVDNTLLYPNCR